MKKILIFLVISLSCFGLTKNRGSSIIENLRNSQDTVFGESIVGVRVPSIASQFQYGYNTDKATVTTANGGTITASDSLLIASTSTASNGTAQIQTKETVRYIPGSESYVFFTSVFTAGAVDSYQRIGLFDDNDGFFIGFEGVNFSVTRRRSGTDYSITQDNFNLDKLDGTGLSSFSVDFTKGNVWQIKYGYLGFATVEFQVMKSNGDWITFHRIEYPNTSTTTHIANTNLPMRGKVANNGNTTDIVMKSGSIATGIIDGGGSEPSTRNFNFDPGTKAITSGTTAVFTLRNKSTFASKTNYIKTLITLITAATDLNKSAKISVYKNSTFTNTPTWTDRNTVNSTVEYSTDATINTGTGKRELTLNLSKVDSLFRVVEELEIELFPSDYITFTVTTTGAGDIDVSARWKELF